YCARSLYSNCAMDY
nr:immunoglobulin heavy chain junction region [Mus musculus]